MVHIPKKNKRKNTWMVLSRYYAKPHWQAETTYFLRQHKSGANVVCMTALQHALTLT